MDEFKKADGETFDEYMMRIGEDQLSKVNSTCG